MSVIFGSAKGIIPGPSQREVEAKGKEKAPVFTLLCRLTCGLGGGTQLQIGLKKEGDEAFGVGVRRRWNAYLSHHLCEETAARDCLPSTGSHMLM